MTVLGPMVADLPAPVGAAEAAVPDWPGADLLDDMMPVMADLAAAGRPFVLATIHAAEGGPRPVGAQLVVTPDRWWGFLSGGCVEADVARHGREALADGEPRRLAYGRGSPVFDIRLPCGGRIELLVERLDPGDPALGGLIDRFRRRRPARYLSDGRARACLDPWDASLALASKRRWVADVLHRPAQRLVVVGHDPFALAIAAAGRHQGWAVALVRPGGPPARPPLDVEYRTEAPAAALATLGPDPWTAVAIATHDPDLDHGALAAALTSEAGYVGLLGSRKRLAGRIERLRSNGVAASAIERLRAPIGLPIAGRSPREVALAVVGEVIDRRNRPQA